MVIPHGLAIDGPGRPALFGPGQAAAFLLLTVAFAAALFYLSSFLRARYWSPIPITITVSSSPVYTPQGGSFAGLDPTAYAIARRT